MSPAVRSRSDNSKKPEARVGAVLSGDGAGGAGRDTLADWFLVLA
jgi:hypothetical protein